MRYADRIAPVILILCCMEGHAVAQGQFKRGDVNADGEVDVADAMHTLQVLFRALAEFPCDDAADANDDGLVDISDPVNILRFLFLGSPTIAPPGTSCGVDETPDSLGCGGYSFEHCPALGSTPDTPAASCFEIRRFRVVGENGNYWIQLPGGVVEAHCDFTSAGGGWTRVATLDATAGFCGNDAIVDLRFTPDASLGRVPDADVRALLAGTPESPHEILYFFPSDGRYVWHRLEKVEDYDTSRKHRSSSFYCTDWHCDDGTIDASWCASEGEGCPVTAHGRGGFTKKIYVDSHFSRHIRGIHTNGNMCGLPNYERAPLWIYVR